MSCLRPGLASGDETLFGLRTPALLRHGVNYSAGEDAFEENSFCISCIGCEATLLFVNLIETGCTGVIASAIVTGCFCFI